MAHEELEPHLLKLPPILRNNLDKNLCVCNEVLKADIIKAIVNGATSLEEVKELTFASDGIGCCKRQVERLIECLTMPSQEDS